MSLPDGLKFLAPGFWVVHVLSVVLVYAYAYRKGRADERREQRSRTAVTPAS